MRLLWALGALMLAFCWPVTLPLGGLWLGKLRPGPRCALLLLLAPCPSGQVAGAERGDACAGYRACCAAYRALAPASSCRDEASAPPTPRRVREQAFVEALRKRAAGPTTSAAPVEGWEPAWYQDSAGPRGCLRLRSNLAALLDAEA